MCRSARKVKGMTLHQLSQVTGIDISVISKIERGKRRATPEQINLLGKTLNLNISALLNQWKAEKLYLAEEETLQVLSDFDVSYQRNTSNNSESFFPGLIRALREDGRVARAYLFGSRARNQAKPTSDIDLMIEFNQTKTYSMFDLMDLAHKLSLATGKQVDLVEMDMLKTHALALASDDLILIYSGNGY